MELPCWCTSVGHQYGKREIMLTSETYFGYQGNGLSEKSRNKNIFLDLHVHSFMSRLAITLKFKRLSP